MDCSKAGRDLQICKYIDNEEFCSDASRRLLRCKQNYPVEEMCVNQNYNKEDYSNELCKQNYPVEELCVNQNNKEDELCSQVQYNSNIFCSDAGNDWKVVNINKIN